MVQRQSLPGALEKPTGGTARESSPFPARMRCHTRPCVHGSGPSRWQAMERIHRRGGNGSRCRSSWYHSTRPMNKSTLHLCKSGICKAGGAHSSSPGVTEEASLNPRLRLLPGHENFLCQRTRGEKWGHRPDEGIYSIQQGKVGLFFHTGVGVNTCRPQKSILAIPCPVVIVHGDLKQLWSEKGVIVKGSDLSGMKTPVTAPGRSPEGYPPRRYVRVLILTPEDVVLLGNTVSTEASE